MEWLALLGESFVAKAFSRSPTLYVIANAGHILSLAMLVGATAILDLRLLGVFKPLPMAPAAMILSRIAAWALGATLLTGALLFSVQPLDYLANTAFLAKLGLVLFGTLNATIVHRSKAWAAVGQGAPPSQALQLGALLSLLTWISAVFAGRWIGFL